MKRYGDKKGLYQEIFSMRKSQSKSTVVRTVQRFIIR